MENFVESTTIRENSIVSTYIAENTIRPATPEEAFDIALDMIRVFARVMRRKMMSGQEW